MALPSCRRPAIVEEEIESRAVQKLKVKLHKVDVFLRDMGKWYEALPRKQKDRLTPRKLKKKAVNLLIGIEYEYERLPLDWVQTLIDRHKIKLYDRIKKEKDYSVPSDKIVSVSIDPLNVIPGNKLVTNKMPSVDTEDGEQNGEPKKKKWIDRTNLAPPPEWLKAYAEGIHLPRVLTFYSCEEYNLIYYDYDPKFKDNDKLKNLEQKVHDANNFNWFRDYQEQEEDDND